MEKWIGRIRSAKKEQVLILLLCGVLLLVIAAPSGEKEKPGMPETETQTVREDVRPEVLTRAREMEERLEEVLGRVAGIGEVKVMLTLRSDGKKILEKDLEQSQGKEESRGENDAAVSDQAASSESTVYQRDAQGNEIPYVTEELEPEIAGVLVVAQGAGNAAAAAEITEAVMALFGVEAHKIKVMKME